MFCPNCGNKLSDTSKFCGRCGINLAARSAAPAPGPQPVPPPAGPYAGTVPLQKQAKGEKQKKNKKLFIGLGVIAALLAVSVVAAGFVFDWFDGGGERRAYTYFSDGRYELITNLGKGESVAIDSCRGDWTEGWLQFSSDGRYVYYFSEFDSYEDTGTLCRAEYGKLVGGSAGNEQYIETIDSNVDSGFYVVGDNEALYFKNKDTLYYYNGKKSVKLARSVWRGSEHMDDKGRIFYQSDAGEGIYNLYGVKADDPENVKKLASGVEWGVCCPDIDHVIYEKEGALYEVGFDSDSKKLADGFDGGITSWYWSNEDGIFYYPAQNGSSLNLYDYVTDEKAEADAEAGLAQPKVEDFSTPEYSYYMITDENPVEASYEGVELYTTCTKTLYWYVDQMSADPTSMEDVASDWFRSSPEDEEIISSTQAFIDKFASQADGDGMILVTDEVKEALKTINQYGHYNVTEDSWLRLCAIKSQTGNRLDEEAYYAAWEKYDEAGSRINLRNTLKEKENGRPVYTLYRYDNGTVTTIHENVLSCEEINGALVYNTVDMVTGKANLEEIGGPSDLEELFALDQGAENYLVPLNGNAEEFQMSPEAAKELAGKSEAQLYYADHCLYAFANGELLAAAVSDGKAGSFSLIDTEVDGVSTGYGGGRDNYDMIDGGTGTIYYRKDVYNGYGDLYSYADGKSKRVLQDVHAGYIIRIFDDGAVLAATDESAWGYELTMVSPGGEVERIAEDVTEWQRIGKSEFLYISDGDLYYYNEKGQNRIAGGVDRLWILNPMVPYLYILS